MDINPNVLRRMNYMVEDRLSDYLGFSVMEIFNRSDNAAIYGGAVRDSIAEREINDIDILCTPKSFNRLKKLLIIKGFRIVEANYNLVELYTDINVIEEPVTFKKDGCLVQLIRPNMGRILSEPFMVNSAKVLEAFYRLLSNVDLSCCGVYFDHNYLQESIHNAVNDCKKGEFRIMENALMLNKKRLKKRVEKFLERGWKNKSNSFYKKIVGDHALDILLEEIDDGIDKILNPPDSLSYLANMGAYASADAVNRTYVDGSILGSP